MDKIFCEEVVFDHLSIFILIYMQVTEKKKIIIIYFELMSMWTNQSGWILFAVIDR